MSDKITTVMDLSKLRSNGTPAGETPITTVKQLRESVHPLTQLMRFFLLKFNITSEEYTRCHQKMSMETYMSPSVASSDRSNTRRTLDGPSLTWNAMTKLFQIFGYDVVGVSVTLHKRDTGEEMVIGTEDVIKFLEEK